MAAARNSVLNDPEVVGKLISLIKESEEKGVGSLSKLTSRWLSTSVARGLVSLLQALKLEFVSMLSQNDLLAPVVTYLVMVAGKSSLGPDEKLRDAVQKDIMVASMKQNWSSWRWNDEGARDSTKAYFNEDGTGALIQQTCLTFDKDIDDLWKAVPENLQYDYVKILS